MSDGNHTPTPWHAQPVAGSYRINGGPKKSKLADVWQTAAHVAEANATFIVDACNQHDDLVAVRNAAAEFLKYFERVSTIEVAGELGQALTTLRLTIAQVGMSDAQREGPTAAEAWGADGKTNYHDDVPEWAEVSE